MCMTRKKGGIPPKEKVGKLNRYINLKLIESDYIIIKKQTGNFSLLPTQCAIIMQ